MLNMRKLCSIRIISLFIQLIALVACVEKESPVAEAGDDRTITSSFNSTIVLNGGESYDPNGDPLLFYWTIEEMPEGSEIELSTAENIALEITLDVPGIYQFGLVVMGGDSFSRKDSVIVSYFPDGSVPFENNPIMVTEHPIVENMDCIQCHQSVEPDFHLLMSGFVFCSGCHFADTWVPVMQVDHIFLSSTCTDCHQLSANHSESSNKCDVCHNTFSWLNGVDPIFPVDTQPPIDHSQIVEGCSNCHIGFFNPTPTLFPHISSTFVCEACHSTSGWNLITIVDHKQLVGTCFSCHDGIFANTKPETHIASTTNCKTCHVTSRWKPLVRVDHNQVFGFCDSCHTAPGNHINRGVNAGCGDCHLAVDFGWQNPSQPLPLR